MGRETAISWTDHTFNPWWGCMKVSPGCTNCYAEAFAKRTGHDVWGPTASYRTFGEKHWSEPLHWDVTAMELGEKQRVFCASMADVFDERAPEGERERLWNLIATTPSLIWQLLTKRPENIAHFRPRVFPANVWIGIAAENQEYFDKRWPLLRNAFGGVKFVSYEPALGPLTLRGSRPDWLIFGGESGPKRRPMEQQWAEDIKADCERLGVKFFMKQMSAITPKKAAELIPAHLLIREFPGQPYRSDRGSK